MPNMTETSDAYSPRWPAEWTEPSDAVWTVEARDVEAPDFNWWTTWTEWVDRATAEAEKQHAVELGYAARIVSAT